MAANEIIEFLVRCHICLVQVWQLTALFQGTGIRRNLATYTHKESKNDIT